MDQGGELGHLLDGGSAEASEATLRAIVGRSHRRQQARLKATTGLALCLALIAGGFALFGGTSSPAGPKPSATEALRAPTSSLRRLNASSAAAGNGGITAPGLTDTDVGVAAPSAAGTKSAFGAVNGAAAPCSSPGCLGFALPNGKLTPLFVHEVASVDVRAYVLVPAKTQRAVNAQGGVVGCIVSRALVLEASTPRAVGEVVLTDVQAGSPDQRPFALIESARIGTAEGSATQLIAARVGRSVAKVTARFADGAHDSMKPFAGWVVLADGGGAALPAHLVALDAAGHVVGQAAVAGANATRHSRLVSLRPLAGAIDGQSRPWGANRAHLVVVDDAAVDAPTPAVASAPEPGEPDVEFVTLYRAHYHRLVRALELAGTNRSSAEDAAQEAFARMLGHWRRVRRGENPAGYVFRVAFRLARRPLRELPSERAPTSPDPSGEAAIRVDVERALAAMPVGRRSCAVACLVVGLSPKEVGRALGIAESTVRKQIERARADLRAAWSEL